MNHDQGFMKGARFLPFLVAVSLISSDLSPMQADNSTGQWALVSQFGGSTQAVAVSGGLVYAGTGLRMNVIDASDPAQPKLVGMSAPFTDTVQDIAIRGQTAYVAAGSAGLLIIDISDPAYPATLGAWKAGGFAEGVAVSGKIVLLADGAKGIRLIDVTDPAAPREVATAYSAYYAFDVIVSKNIALVAAGDAGLLILDVENPSNPRELAQVDTDGYAYEVAQSAGYIYVADAWAGVAVVDISEPLNPLRLDNLKTTGWSLGVSASSNRLASINGGLGVDFFDVSDPTRPIKKSTYFKEPSESDSTARRAAIAGNLVYIADTTNGLRILDIATPERPVQKGLFGLLSYARRLTIRGDYAYVATASEGALYILNIADPLQPYQVSKFQADGIAVDVALSGDYAALGTFEDTTNCITLIDVSNPANPKEASAVDIQSLVCGAPRQMAAKDNLVYAADEWGLSIYDLSDPQAIKTIGRIELQQEGDQTLALSVSGDFAYVGDAGTGLKIVDISDPANPQFIRTYKIASNVGSVFSEADVLVLGHYGEGLTTSANPTPGAMPTLLDSFQTRSSVEEAAVQDGILVASEGSGGLEVLALSPDGDMTLTQAIDTPGFAWASVLSGDYLYIADGNTGVLIFKKQANGQTAAQAPGIPPRRVYPTSITNSIAKGPGAEAPSFPTGIKQVNSIKTCMVSVAADEGSGSLRACLSNAAAGETILFDPAIFPPKNPVTIKLESELPGLEVGSVTVDASNAGVILDGQQRVSSGLQVRSSYNTIMGLQFVNFTMDGITLEFPGQFNQIGGDHTVGLGPSGQGNSLSGDTNGIRALYTSHNIIKGNFIGTNAQGTQAGKPNSIGIILSNFATDNIIGGESIGEKNIISNNDRGVDIAANTAINNIVAGNFIGTDVTGTKAIPNTSWGVLVEVGGRNNVIGGTSEAERNIISGNNMGVCVSDYASTQNSIIGNYIGVDVSGQKALPNQDGACIFQSAYNRFGGTLPGEANVISGNSNNGVRFFGMGPTHAILLGNTLGLDASGQRIISNNTGVLLDGGTHSMIGGMSEGAGNIFSGNNLGIRIENGGTSYNWLAGNLITASGQAGVMINSHADNNFLMSNTITNSETGVVIIQAEGNALRANSISGNKSWGIEIRDGGNADLAAPTINQASATGVDGSACPACVVEIFSDSGDQGLIYEGFVLADSTGAFSYRGKVTGPRVTATTTDQNGNTSSFSEAAPVQ